MYLKTLELSGFKSFAKPSTLAFPSRITAIVGPNGSGKSNIKEAIQWALGEQSLKELRGRRGEDLIWNGTPRLGRLGRASVTLAFDNANRLIPVDFEEVAITRTIFRDGAGEYAINTSPVRLKDIIQLTAHMGMGQINHNIIGQGEVDRVILANGRQRYQMLQEALGLRVYQLKKSEAEHKLESTGVNIAQVEALIREISPYLKFLRTQAKKAEARQGIEKELHEYQHAYVKREHKEIEKENTALDAMLKPVLQRERELKEEISRLEGTITEREEAIRSLEGAGDEDEALWALEEKGRRLEHELGRLEGRLELEREKFSHPRVVPIDLGYVKEEIRGVAAELRAIIEEHITFEDARPRVLSLAQSLERTLANIERGSVEESREEHEWEIVRALEQSSTSLQQEREDLKRQMEEAGERMRQAKGKSAALRDELKEFDNTLRQARDELRNQTLVRERASFQEERLQAREEALEQNCREFGISIHQITLLPDETSDGLSNEELKRKIERLSARLEEIGGIDANTLKEYGETAARHDFLTRELEDLKQARMSCGSLIKELDKRIRDDFAKGLSKIKEEFNTYFRVIFGGGKATLTLQRPETRDERRETKDERQAIGEQEGDEGPDGEVQEEIDIAVDLPRKRIRSLAMLSGGEKALASLALLFAVTAVNPPPFLVLDETDAALDEANSQRYAAIVKELAKRTQLILITHNRETMKSAGVLYGVTVGDDGASKLLSLKLEEAEAYTNR